jgi:hypothetical protein
MKPSTLNTLNTLLALRKASADVVALVDLIIYGAPGEAEVARQVLPRRIRTLEMRVKRALETLEGKP